MPISIVLSLTLLVLTKAQLGFSMLLFLPSESFQMTFLYSVPRISITINSFDSSQRIGKHYAIFGRTNKDIFKTSDMTFEGLGRSADMCGRKFVFSSVFSLQINYTLAPLQCSGQETELTHQVISEKCIFISCFKLNTIFTIVINLPYDSFLPKEQFKNAPTAYLLVFFTKLG